jgi:hypothetical protein
LRAVLLFGWASPTLASQSLRNFCKKYSKLYLEIKIAGKEGCPMSTTKVNYFAGRMHKLKSNDVRGMQIHNQRERESQTNKTIDKTKTLLNYDLVNEEPIDYKSKISERIEEAVESDKKIRKDAVLCNQWIITSDKTFFDRIGEDEEKRFFQESYKWFADRYGKENVIFATVHKDEHTPHMHLGIVPIKEGKLSSKDLFNRVELKAIQDKFPKHLQKLGFDLERGIPNKQKHVQPEQWKLEQEKGKLRQVSKDLEKTEDALKSKIEALRGISNQVQWVDGIEVKEKGLFKKDKVEIKKNDWEVVKNQAKQAVVYKYDLDQVKEDFKITRHQNELLKVDREKARKFDRLGDLFGKEKIEEVLEVDRQQHEQQRQQQKIKSHDLDRER